MHEIPFLVAAGGGEDFRAEMARHLDRGDADATRRTMDQYPFAGLHIGQVLEGVINREEYRRYGRRLLERPGRRFGGGRSGLGDDMAGEAGRREGDDFVADAEFVHARADTGDAAGQFKTKGCTGKTVLHGFIGKQTHCIHHVAEIQADGGRANLDLVIRQRARYQRSPVQVAQLSRHAEVEPVPGLGCFRGRQGRLRHAHHAWNVATTAGQHDLAFAIRRQQFAA